MMSSRVMMPMGLAAPSSGTPRLRDSRVMAGDELRKGKKKKEPADMCINIRVCGVRAGHTKLGGSSTKKTKKLVRVRLRVKTTEIDHTNAEEDD